MPGDRPGRGGLRRGRFPPGRRAGHPGLQRAGLRRGRGRGSGDRDDDRLQPWLHEGRAGAEGTARAVGLSGGRTGQALGGGDAWDRWPWPNWAGDGAAGESHADARHRPRPVPATRHGKGVRGGDGYAGGIAFNQRRGFAAHTVDRGNQGVDQRRHAGANEAGLDPGQHLARCSGRHGGVGRGVTCRENRRCRHRRTPNRTGNRG